MKLIAIAVIALVAACVSYRASPADIEAANAAADLDLREYKRTTSPFARAAFCASASIATRNGQPGVDAGGAIDCNPPPPPKPIAASVVCVAGYECEANGLCWCSWWKDGGTP